MASEERIIVVGAGGHARAVLDVIRSEGRYAVAGLLDSSRERGTHWLGAEVLGDESALPDLCRALDTRLGLVAVGDNWQRRALMQRLEERVPGFAFASCVHPKASVAADALLGAGSVVMPGAVVVSGCRIGRGCIVNTLASLDHDGVMEDFASLAPGVVAGGNVHVGACAALSLGARVMHGIRIGPHAVVGAGALVLEEVPAQVVAFGVPARVIRPRALDEPYL
jgi:sugar O-acyltransferase (sialic acid O-acetyltransferase NeuD family)